MSAHRYLLVSDFKKKTVKFPKIESLNYHLNQNTQIQAILCDLNLITKVIFLIPFTEPPLKLFEVPLGRPIPLFEILCTI